MRRSSLAKRLDLLEKAFGPCEPAPVTDPYEAVLWENVAYLQPDEKRRLAFETLRKRVGLMPEEILSVKEETLFEVASLGGMRPHDRVERLRFIAELVLSKLEGDPARLMTMPVGEARKVLRKFPGIGEPGADRILLFAGRLPALGPDSNSLRVLTRLGYAVESKDYGKTYRSAIGAVESEIEPRCDWLARAHLLLRRHGRTVCKASAPLCEACPLSEGCAYYLR